MILYCCGCCEKVNARLTNGLEIYPHREDLKDLLFYKCDKCKNYVGTHKGTENPLGCIPTKEIMKARHYIHKLIDPLWKSKKIKRKELYRKIAECLNIKQYHTAWTRSIEECREVYLIGLNIRKELINE